jgi:subtilisin family serine protease
MVCMVCERAAVADTGGAGEYYRIPNASGRDEMQAMCDSTRAFVCKEVFETGVFGTPSDTFDKSSAFGASAEGPGLEFLQDLTEGSIHPHSVLDTPHGLASVTNLAGREIGAGDRKRFRRLAQFGDGTSHEQKDAPFYLTFLQEEERGKCRRTELPNHACLADDVFRISHSGEGVLIYELGEDVQADHIDFGGRVSKEKFVGTRIGARREFCEDWQGTHVASLAAGATHGVAKAATIVPVAVKPGCRIAGSVLDMLRGLQWTIEHRRRNPDKPAVMFTSTKVAVDGLDQVAIDILEDLVRVLVYDFGTIVVATSGANALDASRFTPGRMHEVITVGGLEVYKEISLQENVATTWLNSNYGEPIDIWSPAAFIDAAFPVSNNGTSTYSGVPQASALVAGVIASMLSYSSSLTPDDVKRQLRIRSSENLMIMTRPRNIRSVLQIPSDWSALVV